MNVSVGLLKTDLRRLRIATPVFEHADNREDVFLMISYLGAIEGLSGRGALQEARQMKLSMIRVYDVAIRDANDAGAA